MPDDAVYKGMIYFNFDTDDIKSFSFKAKTGTVLVPIGASPYWTLNKAVKSFRVDFDGHKPGDKIRFNVSILSSGGD